MYRYSWLRDGAFCAVALDEAGEGPAARRFHDWVAARVLAFEAPMRRAIEALAAGGARDQGDYLPCRFTAEGEVPVNDGWGDFQMDGPGLWLWSLGEHAAGQPVSGALRQAALLTAEYLVAMWREPSYDAWEEHPDRLSTSTLGADLAGLLSARRLGLDATAIASAIEAIREEIASRGRRLGYLPRSDRDEAIDASILWCGPLLGAIDLGDPAWLATLDHIRTELVGPDGGVHRYPADSFYGGGEWPVLAAALGLVYLSRDGAGDRDRARRCLDWIDRQRDEDGSLPEQGSAHLLDPGSRAAWLRRWGQVARPLTWSHAMAALLHAAVADAS